MYRIFKKSQVMNRVFIATVLVLILLISPCLPTDELDLKTGEEIDQIDYKGPETHPFNAPPRSKFGPHKSTVVLDSKSKSLQYAGPLGRKGACRDQGNVIP